MDAPPLPPAIEPEKPRPLLPAVILGPGAVLGLWALPMLLLLLLNVQGYALIEGNMDTSQRGRALILGLAGLLNLGVALTVYGVVKRRIRWASDDADIEAAHSSWWGLVAVVMNVAYLWLAMSWSATELLPASVTAWIYPPERYLYNQFAFAMVPLFWGLMRIACIRTGRGLGGSRPMLVNVGLAVGAPVLLFLLFQLLRMTDAFWALGSIVMAVVIIGCGLAIFVGIIRAIAYRMRDIDTWSPGAERIAILIFALAMPAGGLLLNREIPFPNDFQAWEVYALTVINAVVLLLASWQHERRPLLSLGLLCATLPFSLYFFVVFLPFLPLSILGVILMGLGFLVLAPTVLFILHLSLLNKARSGSQGRQFATGAMCFLLLPGFFTVRSLADKAALNTALDYVYAPSIKDGPITYEASRVNLRRALTSHRSYKNGIYYPLLSDYYAWLVFDNLVLPDDKLARLESVFFGEPGGKESGDPVRMSNGFFGGSRGSNRDRNHMPRAARPPRTVVEENLDVKIAPAGSGASTVTLSLTLKNTGSQNAEYAATLPLPAGVFVNGFRLFIEGKPVSGRITEKKTALWVYTMIRDSERRDPGLLFYNTPDKLELRVFPVAAIQPSVVEMDFLVPAEGLDAADLGADTKDPAAVLARIGASLRPALAALERGTVAGGGFSANPPPAVERPAYLHVIVDRSADNGFDGDLPAALAQLAERIPSARSPRVTLANYETLTLPEADAVTAASLEALPLRGGFAFDLALAQAIRRHRDVDLDGNSAAGTAVPPRPVFVILSRKNTSQAPMPGVAEAWLDLLPALEIRSFDAAGSYVSWPASGGGDALPLMRVGQSIRTLVPGRMPRFGSAPVDAPLEYWSPAEQRWQAVDSLARVDAGAPWAKAAALHLAQQDHDRTPGDSGVDLKALVKQSRETGVMLPSTSYIVVENSAQWRMLDVAERQKLDQNSALSFKETPAPSWVWMAAGLLAWLGFRKWRSLRLRAAVSLRN
jgi:hypothetical protein